MENKFLKLALVSATIGMVNMHVGYAIEVVQPVNARPVNLLKYKVFLANGGSPIYKDSNKVAVLLNQKEAVDQNKKVANKIAKNEPITVTPLDEPVNKLGNSDTPEVNQDEPANKLGNSDDPEGNQNDVNLLGKTIKDQSKEENKELNNNDQKIDYDNNEVVQETNNAHERTWGDTFRSASKWLAGAAVLYFCWKGANSLRNYLSLKPDYNKAKDLVALKNGEYVLNQKCSGAVNKLNADEVNQYNAMDVKDKLLAKSDNENVLEVINECPVNVGVEQTQKMAANAAQIANAINNAENGEQKIKEPERADLSDGLKNAQDKLASKINKNAAKHIKECEADIQSDACQKAIKQQVEEGTTALENNLKQMYKDLNTEYAQVVEEDLSASNKTK